MKNNQLTAVFLGLFFLSTLANAWVIYKYNSSFRQMQQLQSGLMVVNVIQGLYNESAEYSKSHPDMAHLLQSTVGGQAQRPAATAPVPAKPQPNK
jgi:hypothetical protein